MRERLCVVHLDYFYVREPPSLMQNTFNAARISGIQPSNHLQRQAKRMVEIRQADIESQSAPRAILGEKCRIPRENFMHLDNNEETKCQHMVIEPPFRIENQSELCLTFSEYCTDV